MSPHPRALRHISNVDNGFLQEVHSVSTSRATGATQTELAMSLSGLSASLAIALPIDAANRGVSELKRCKSGRSPMKHPCDVHCTHGFSSAAMDSNHTASALLQDVDESCRTQDCRMGHHKQGDG